MAFYFVSPDTDRLDGLTHSSYQLVKHFKKRGIYPKQGDVTDAKTGDTVLVYGYPDKAEGIPTGVNLYFYSMFESTRWPSEWAKYFKRARRVFVPSLFCQKGYARSYPELAKDQLPTIVPLAIDHEVFEPQDDIQLDRFTFLTYNSGFGAHRKGFQEVCEAFKLAFEPTEPVELLVKSAHPEYFRSGNKAFWGAMKTTFHRGEEQYYRNMRYIAESSTPTQMAEYLRRADCFVFPSRGEGFGHPPLEAMAVGTPVIMPNKHALADYFDPEVHFGVKASPIPAKYDKFDEDLGLQWSAEADDLARAMREAYEEDDASRQERIRKGQATSRQYDYMYTVHNLAQNFLSSTGHAY